MQRSLVIPNTHMHQVNPDLHSVFSSPLTTQPTKESGSSSHPRYGDFWQPGASFKASRALGSPLQDILPPHLNLLPASTIPNFNSSCISPHPQQAEQGRAARELFNPFCKDSFNIKTGNAKGKHSFWKGSFLGRVTPLSLLLCASPQSFTPVFRSEGRRSGSVLGSEHAHTANCCHQTPNTAPGSPGCSRARAAAPGYSLGATELWDAAGAGVAMETEG